MISAAFTDNLLNLAAIVYRPEDDADSLLRDFAIALIHKGHKLGGLVQRNEKNDQHQHAAMELIDLMTGRVFPISQAGRDCKLDPGALANAALAIGRALDAGVELVIVNKFSAQEAAGKGLRNELATAATTGLPVLTAVPEKTLWRLASLHWRVGDDHGLPAHPDRRLVARDIMAEWLQASA